MTQRAQQVAGAMTDSIAVRPIAQTDYDAWKPLWDGYNAFYGREHDTALPHEITLTTWQRLFRPCGTGARPGGRA